MTTALTHTSRPESSGDNHSSQFEFPFHFDIFNLLVFVLPTFYIQRVINSAKIAANVYESIIDTRCADSRLMDRSIYKTFRI